jgi:hypothetical protein
MIRRFAGLLLAVSLLAAFGNDATARAADRPNILWLTSEDHGPHMGCYGDRYATTPNVDKLAARGVIYTRAWSNAPVCAPARTTLISGMHAMSTGGEHMRSLGPDPSGTLSALNALDALGPKAAPLSETLKGLPTTGAVPNPRYAPYVPRLMEDLLSGWKAGKNGPETRPE